MKGASCRGIARRRVMLVSVATVLLVPGGRGAAAQSRPYTADDASRVPQATPHFHEKIREDSLRRDSAAKRVSATAAHLGSLILDIPEYHDEQRFRDGAGLGPMAYVFASPYLGGFNHINQVNAHGTYGMLVAVLWVDPPGGGGSLPQLYLNLKLSPGVNCAYLAHTGPNPASGWSAYMVPGTVGQPCPRPTVPGQRLPARRTPPGTEILSEDYPAVARFGEDFAGSPTVGVRCLIGWCEIGGGALLPQKPVSHTGFAYLMARREGRVRGWHDDQVLSVMNAAGSLVPTIRATVTPVPGLERMGVQHFTQQWVRVATIWLASNPAGTKYGMPTAAMPKTWGMHGGLNALELAFANGKWEAQITQVGPNGTINPGTPTTRLIVAQMPHMDLLVPGTARFRWRMNDEAVWVRCDQGCCQVDSAIQ
jgi:hypothetical protein